MTVTVATKEETDALAARLAELERLVAKLAGGTAEAAREYLTPREIAKRYRIRESVVYNAIADGKLTADKRPISQGRVGYLVKLAEAVAWYDACVRPGRAS